MQKILAGTVIGYDFSGGKKNDALVSFGHLIASATPSVVMSSLAKSQVTGLLQAWSAGDSAALEALTPLVYEELRRLARHYMLRERPGHTLQPTALVNEVYLRVVDASGVSWQSRAHFMAICARLMRQILIESARARQSQKRAGGIAHTELEETLLISSDPPADVLVVDVALRKFATFDERASRVVELRFFGGLTVNEVAEVLKVSPETVLRDWKAAKVWLVRELSGGVDFGS